MTPTRQSRYDIGMKCYTIGCTNTATWVVVFGCLEQHMKERYVCVIHKKIFEEVIPKTQCDKCSGKWEESLWGRLPATRYLKV